MEEDKIETKKIDIKMALSVIPPASQLMKKEKKQKERRIRLRFHNELKKDIAKINTELAKELGVKDQVEIVVAHRRRFRYKVEIDDEVPPTEVWVNGEDLPEQGVADNSIATIRAL